MCAVHPWAVDRCTAFLTSCSLHSHACTHMHTCTHIHISWHDVIKCCHPTWGDKTSNSKGVNIHPNIWMFKLLTKNASICQNSNHQRETKSSSLAQWALFVFQNRLWPFSVPAFSMSPGLILPFPEPFGLSPSNQSSRSVTWFLQVDRKLACWFVWWKSRGILKSVSSPRKPVCTIKPQESWKEKF